MPHEPKISVVMSVFNGAKYIGEAIESILNQTVTDFEFIIVDDGSTDDSLKIIQNYHDKRIHLIENKRNIGLTRSLNKAFKQAGGEYLARQDADDISWPIRFAEQLEYLEQHREVALLGTSVYRIDEKGKILGQSIMPIKPGKSLFRENQFSHGSTMFRREVFDQLGGYNELLRYSQDYELWLRIAQCYEVRNLPQALYSLRLHSEIVTLKHVDESAMCHLLALRLAQDNLAPKMVEAIGSNRGVKGIYNQLTRNEKVAFHVLVANVLVRNGDTKRAKREYKDALRLNHFDVSSWANLFLLSLGGDFLNTSHRIYFIFKNYLISLKNFASGGA
jgi:glycosyltransferase involved in cell wall biosynthesis